MTREEKRALLRDLRADLDARAPGWRDTPAGDGAPSRFVAGHFEFPGEPAFDLVLHMKPEPVTVESGTEFGEFEPGAP